MNKLFTYLLKMICKRIVIQGFDHKRNIVEYYKILHEAATEQFTEDNRPTLDGFLTDCHEEAKNEIHLQRPHYFRIQPQNQTG